MHPNASPTMTRLNAEWETLRTRRPVGSTGMPWSRISPRLDVTEVGEITDRLQARPDPQEADEILWPLLYLAGEGDELAARTVLQATLGMAMRLVSRARARALDDPEAAALASVWTAIRTYPLRRRQRVAANLAGTALKALPTHHEIASPTPLPMDINETVDRPEHPDLEEASALLLWARTHRILSEKDLDLMQAIHLHGTSTSDAGAPLGLNAVATRQRLSRATRTLAAAVRDRMQGMDSQDVVAQVRYELNDR